MGKGLRRRFEWNAQHIATEFAHLGHASDLPLAS